MKRKRLFWISGGILVVAIAFVIHTMYVVGAFTDIEPHGPESLHMVHGFVGGTEDVVFRPDDKHLFVSSANFSNPSQPGAIYHVDVTLHDADPRDVTPDLDFPLQPHGIDLHRDADGTERLFVVNHRAGSGFTMTAGDLGAVEHTIEVFVVSPDGGLTHETTYRDEALFSPNDIAAIGPDTFYVTNDHGTKPGLLRMVEDWFRLPLGDVVYHDGTEFRVVHEGTRYANGIAATRDGATVYVAETTGNGLHQFDRDPETGALTWVTNVDEYSGLDNLHVADDGSVWTAAHPNLLAFLRHAHDEARYAYPGATPNRSPSQVLRYVPQPPGGWRVEEFYLNDGDPLSGASVAVTNGDVVVLGAVFDGRLVVLPLRSR